MQFGMLATIKVYVGPVSCVVQWHMLHHFTHADFCMAVCLGEFLGVDTVIFSPQKLCVCSVGNVMFEDADSANRAILGLGTLAPPEEAPDGFGRSGCLVEMLSPM